MIGNSVSESILGQSKEVRDAVITKKTREKIVISLSREYGSGGRYIRKADCG